MISYIRKSRWAKVVSLTLAFSFVSEVIFPTVALALTGGPSQPEVESFAPIEATDMVDLFSGDFKYNIPLLDVDGYPINLNYNSNITMDQEASWVGLGWNLNPGVINRSMRGLPDEFCGDLVTKEFNVNEELEWGLGFRLGDLELFGFSFKDFGLGVSLDMNLGIKYNSYDGYGLVLSANPITSMSEKVSDDKSGNIKPKSLARKIASFNFSNNIKSLENKALGFVNSHTGNILNNKYLKSFAQSSGLDRINYNPIEAIRYGILNKNTKSYTPQIKNNISNFAMDYNVKTGVTLFGSAVSLMLYGYHSKQMIDEKVRTFPAYGYLSSEKAMGVDDALLDFTRENDGSFDEKATNLPLTNYTYDTYSILGQGLTGSFRPHRGVIDYVFDNDAKNTSTSGNVGAELDFGNMIHAGVDLNFNVVWNNSGVWDGITNLMKPKLQTSTLTYNKNLYENSYWKESSELNIESDAAFHDKYLKDEPTKVDLFRFAIVGLASNKLKSPSSSIIVGSSIKRNYRDRRNTSISSLTAKEASYFGIEKNINIYPKNTSTCGFYNHENGKIQMNRTVYGENHPSELTVLKGDGARYVFGIPAYNLTQVDASFSVSASANGELVSYTSTEDSKSNSSGKDHYYSKTILPKYAHSYLLTTILSADYVDLTGDGPTDDDLGNYTKFNYTKLPGSYNWKTPLTGTGGYGLYDKGLEHTKKDDKASYSYGEKEVWYLQSIETKTQVAEFYVSSRYDGYGVQSANGTLVFTNPVCLQKLDKIVLYSKVDRLHNTTNAIPIKTVHFEYDYALCKNTPNSNASPDKGKLTLKKLYFTYGKSKKGKFNFYEFLYDNATETSYRTLNPSYDFGSNDRWGTYKPKPTTGASLHEYPYAEQDKTKADENASAWSLSEIKLPSGGQINIKYESDDYAYVQGERAMKMFSIASLDNPDPTKAVVDDVDASSIFIKLENPYNDLMSNLTDAEKKKKFKQLFLENMDYLYFRCKTQISRNNVKEYISGYAEIKTDEDIELRTIGGQLCYGVRVKNVDIDETDNLHNNKISPIAKAGIEFCKSETPYFAKGETSDTPHDISINFDGLIAALGLIGDLIKMTKNVNEKMYDSYDIGKSIELTRSWIRLRDPVYNKKGGGARVRQIKISDNWNIAGEAKSEYGQEYDYTIKAKCADDVERFISSGVAAYEPGNGGDENPLKKPIYKRQDSRILCPSEKSYIEGPIGESFYPGAGVGYSQVTVKNISHQGVTRHATGKVVHEFFTAKDFPVKVTQTTLQSIPGMFSLMNVSISNMTVSQGYSIICNDMHGKQKAILNYAENKQNPTSGEYYDYKASGNTVLSDVDYFAPDGTKHTGEMGVDRDFVIDFRHHHSFGLSVGMKINSETIMALALPIIIPTLFGNVNVSNNNYFAAVGTKVINQRGILTGVRKFDLSSEINAENLAYDQETGDVLLTKTVNEFNDPVYSFKQPAYWAYEEMGPAYKNQAMSYSGLSIVNGVANITDANKFFTTGDELSCVAGNGTMKKLWVLDANKNQISVIDHNGIPVTENAKSLKILRSGYRNVASAPIFETSFLNYTLLNNKLNFNSDSKILSASATEYDNIRQLYKCYDESPASCSKSLTPTMLSIFSLLQKLTSLNKLITQTEVSLNSSDFSSIMTTEFRESLKKSNSYPIAYKGTTTTLNKIECKLIYIIGNTQEEHVLATIDLNGAPQNFVSEISNQWLFGIDFAFPKGCTLEDPCILSFINMNNQQSPLMAKLFVTTGGDYSGIQMYVTENYSPCFTECSQQLNPYSKGLLAHWYPKLNYEFLTHRYQSNHVNLDIRRDGYFDEFTPFWEYDTQSGYWKPSGATSWTAKSTVTKVHPYGMEIESKNPLNIYSSAIYGYENKMALAVANNAKYREISYNGFEDYSDIAICNQDRSMYGIKDASGNNITLSASHLSNLVAHTGEYSVALQQGSSFEVRGELSDEDEIGTSHDEIVNINKENPAVKTTVQIPYMTGSVINQANVKYYLPGFSPVVKQGVNSKYLVSFWIYYPSYSAALANLPIELKVEYKDAGNTIVHQDIIQNLSISKTPIEGWVKVDAVAGLDNNYIGNAMVFSVKNTNTGSINMDDFRMLPLKASMKSYCYHPVTYKFVAELDENNYATIYEYDEEGALARVKKETEKGIFTIKEVMKSFPKKGN